ncbi:hypothetical protein SRHO_G00344380 [Serrasalmus rhombeus]
MYEKARDQLAASLACVEFYASTTDIWSSRTTEPYLSLTVHYINSEWKLCSSCLETSYLPEDHTGQNIANDLREFLQSWRLKEENQVCVTTDSGANVVKAVKLNNWSRLSCFGHRLHIAIERSLKDTRVDRAVSVGKKIVSAFSHSWKRQRALQEVQRDMGLPQHKLVTETPTRWGSKQKMIQRLLEQEKAITQVLAADRSTRHLVPTWQDIEVLDSVNKALGPLLEFTNALSAEDYVTVSCLKPVLQLFSSDILQVKENDTDLTKTIKNSVLDYLNSKYEDPEVDELIALATMLDPRFRTQYMGPEEIEVMKARAVQEMESYVSVQSGTSDFETPQQASASASDAKRLKKTLGSFFKRAVPDKGVHAMEAELNSYLQCSPADSESNPLAWWKLHEINFPRKYRDIILGPYRPPLLSTLTDPIRAVRKRRVPSHEALCDDRPSSDSSSWLPGYHNPLAPRWNPKYPKYPHFHGCIDHPSILLVPQEPSYNRTPNKHNSALGKHKVKPDRLTQWETKRCFPVNRPVSRLHHVGEERTYPIVYQCEAHALMGTGIECAGRIQEWKRTSNMPQQTHHAL